MRKIIVFLPLFLITGIVWAGMTYDAGYYRNHKSQLSSATQYDPVYMFIREAEERLEDARTYVKFNSNAINGTVAGGASAGTALAVDLSTVNGVTFERFNMATQTILGPNMISTTAAAGLNISQDLTNNDGVEWTQGITAASKHAYTVGTSGAFYLKVKLDVNDVSGTDRLAVGFRKAEAYQADMDDYDELVCLDVNSGDIVIATILNGGATTYTDTTDNWADNAAKTLEIYVSAAGVVTYLIDGASPTTTAAFTFDSGEVVIPFLQLRHDTDVAEQTCLVEWDCGLQW